MPALKQNRALILKIGSYFKISKNINRCFGLEMNPPTHRPLKYLYSCKCTGLIACPGSAFQLPINITPGKALEMAQVIGSPESAWETQTEFPTLNSIAHTQCESAPKKALQE